MRLLFHIIFSIEMCYSECEELQVYKIGSVTIVHDRISHTELIIVKLLILLPGISCIDLVFANGFGVPSVDTFVY